VALTDASRGARIALSLYFVTGVACADSFHSTRSPELREHSHRVDVRVAPGHATLTVRRTVFNGGDQHDQATFFLHPPDGAVATGLRTLGLLDGRPHWFRGDLMEAESAAAKYRELTGIGGFYPKDPALLSWRSHGELALQVFPCPPHSKKTVEYTLTLPTGYWDGRHQLRLDTPGTNEVRPLVTLRPSAPRDALYVDGEPWKPGRAVWMAPGATLEVTLETRKPEIVSGALASMSLGSGRAFSRLHVDTAPRLGRRPRGAYVVVVVDASHSLRPTTAAVAGAFDAYLSHLPDAHAQIVTFDRTAKALLPGFETTPTVREHLATREIPTGNGSNVDAALRLAARELAKAPAGAPRRVVLLTDGLTRASLTPESLRAAAPRRNLLHIGLLDGAAGLSPDSSHPWNAATTPTGGVVWHVGLESEAAHMQWAFEEWVRPRRLHDVEIAVDGLAADEVDAPTELFEGQRFERLALGHRATRWLELRGKSWARPVTRRLSLDAKETRRWAAMIFGTELVSELSEAEMTQLAMHGGAVSPVTSYLAVEPGVRPSTEGLDWGLGGIGVGGGGRSEGIGLGHIGVLSSFDPVLTLQRALAEPWARCGGGAVGARVSIETTYDEIVDVPDVRLNGPGSERLRQCLTEAVWALRLPGQFRVAHTLHIVSL